MKSIIQIADYQASDESLIEAIIQDRSEEALNALHHRHGSVLRGVILRVIRDESEVDDVLQDVFLQVWSRAETYSPEKGRLLGWLITLARRRALDRLRQRCAYSRACDRYEAENKSSVPQSSIEGFSTDSQACNDDLRKLLSKMLNKLPPQQGQVVKMTYFQGMSQRQIAANLSVPLGTVKTRIELGMRKLSSALVPLREKVA